MPALALSTYNHERDNAPRSLTMEWDAFAERLRVARRCACTLETCGQGEHAKRNKAGEIVGCRHKYGSAWTPAAYPEGATRANDNVQQIAVTSLDVDHVTDEQLGDVIGRIRRYQYVIHATHSDRPGNRCVRVVLAQSRPVLASEWERYWPAVVARLELPGVDPAPKDLARLFFSPSRPSDGEYLFLVGNGQPLDVDEMLATAVQPTLAPIVSIAPGVGLAPGHRHAALISMAGAMRRRGADAATIYAALVPFNAAQCNPPKPDEELREIAAYVEGKPTPAPEPGTFEHDIASARSDIANALGSASETKREPLFIDAAHLFTREFPLAIWAVVGLLTRGGLGTIGGEPKTAKTWSALEIAIAMATRSKAFGEFFAESGTAAYFFAEDLDKQIRNRVRALLAGRNLTHEALGSRLHVCPRGKFLDVVKDEDLAWIVASCRKLGPIDLLVLDPLRDVSSAAEDKSDEMGPVMRRLRLLGELLGCTVLVVHHAAKASESTKGRRPGQRLRGSGAIHGSTDSGIYLGEFDGDGSNLFRNSVVSEVKGARSAGSFILDLAITDDDNGEAELAAWTVTRAGGKPKTQHQEDDELVFTFVRDLAIRSEHLSRRKLREHDERPLPEKRVVQALDRLIGAKRLVLDGAAVSLPQQSSRENS